MAWAFLADVVGQDDRAERVDTSLEEDQIWLLTFKDLGENLTDCLEI